LLFNEIYNTYYNVVAAILEEAIDGTLSKERINEIIDQKAFQESILRIPEKLEYNWGLLNKNHETPILNYPRMPLTILQKRWMKSLLLDPRIQLFSPDFSGLEDVEPLFVPDTFLYFDRNGEGDPYDSSEYIQLFQTILITIREKKWLRIQYQSKKRQMLNYLCMPVFLEYSMKDDRFRVYVITEHVNNTSILNLSQIKGYTGVDADEELLLAETMERRDTYWAKPSKSTITLEVRDKRNALERLLLNFSSMEKEVRRMGEDNYVVKLTYDLADETEILIRILSFGPMIHLIEPESMREKIRERLRRQLILN